MLDFHEILLVIHDVGDVLVGIGVFVDCWQEGWLSLVLAEFLVLSVQVGNELGWRFELMWSDFDHTQ